MDIKRIALWVVFTFSLLMLWDNWTKTHTEPVAQTAQAQTQTNTNGDATLPNASATTSTSNDSVAADTLPAAQASIITVTTDTVKADVSTVGGQFVRLELLKYLDTEDKTKNFVLFDNIASNKYIAQTGLIRGDYPNHNTLFSVKEAPHQLDNGDTQLVLAAEKDGVELDKVYTFSKDGYNIDLKHVVINKTDKAIDPQLYLRLLRDGNKPAGDNFFYHTFTGPAVYTEAEKFQKFTFEEVGKGDAKYEKAADNGWTAIIQHYFVSAFIPPQTMQRTLSAQRVSDNLYAMDTLLSLGSIAPGATASLDVHLYAGPQVSSILEKTAPGLDLVKDYGIFTILSKPLFWFISHAEGVVGNWGWAIVITVIFLKLLFFPLSAAGYKSMAKMKIVGPKIQALRERYKGEPQKMNQEMMKLYKTEKINPMGGCLPMLIQIPVFISLYWALLASVEMRNAPWIGWIHDLSAPDPFFILPVLMALSMFLQTKLNPTPPDPLQAKIMMFMPIAFSVMFFFFPAGLVLYWVVNNILAIAQQWFITKKLIKK